LISITDLLYHITVYSRI